MATDNVEIVEIDDEDEGVLCFDGSSEKNPIKLDYSDDEETRVMFPVGMLSSLDRKCKRKSDVNIGHIDVDSLDASVNEEPCIMFPVGMSGPGRKAKRAIDFNQGCIDVDSLDAPVSRVNEEPCIMFPVGMSSSHRRKAKRKIDLNVEHIDVVEETRDFDLNRDDVEDDVKLIDDLAPVRKRNKCETSKSRLDSSIGLHTFKCEICVDDKPIHELFVIKGCNHHYCSECITRYVASKLDDNIPHITCPVTGCKGLLDPEECQEILPTQVFYRWGDALCDSLFPASQKVYCPYKNCSGLLIDDCKRGKKVITKSECLHCKRLFCFVCRSPWHEKMKCEEFKELNKDRLEAEDVMLMKLAKSKKWQRCPKCKFYVQKNRGCQHMSCRLVGTFFELINNKKRYVLDTCVDINSVTDVL